MNANNNNNKMKTLTMPFLLLFFINDINEMANNAFSKTSIALEANKKKATVDATNKKDTATIAPFLKNVYSHDMLNVAIITRSIIY